jgi:hypothetical protein
VKANENWFREHCDLSDADVDDAPPLSGHPGRPGATDPGAATGVRRVESVPASQVERKQVAWAIPGRVAYGYLSLLIGEQGLGKSTWLSWLAAQNSHVGEVTLVCSAEDGWDTTIRPRLEAWEADLRLVRFVEVALADRSADGLLLPDDIDELSREIHDTGAKIVTIDPVLAHLGRGIDSHRDASTRQALAPLARIASEHGCAIVAAHHLNKSAGTDPLARASASVAFTAQARSVLLWARDPDDENGERGNRRALASVKSNLARLAPTQLWQVEPIVLPAAGAAPEVETSRVALIGESEHTGRDLLRVRDDDEHASALEEAKAFLGAELVVGAVQAKTLLATARSVGIAEKTLRRAAEELGVKKGISGFHEGWIWNLPEGGQGGWPSSGSDEFGHLRENDSTMRVCDPSEPLEDAKVANTNELGTFVGEVDLERARRFDALYPPRSGRHA